MKKKRGKMKRYAPHLFLFTLSAAFIISLGAFFFSKSGQANFSPTVNYPSTGADGVTYADLDNDQDPDLIVSNYLGSGVNGNVSVYFNNGSGAFGAAVPYAVLKGPTVVAAVDVDGDFDIDIVVNDSNSNSFSVLKNINGSGMFDAAVNYGTVDAPSAMDVADVDGDLDKDVVLVSYTNNNAAVFLNSGVGVFAAPVMYPAGNSSSPAAVFVGDVDGDTDRDIVTGNQGLDSISVLKNSGSGVFAAPVSYPAGGGITAIYGADLDGDTDIDIVAADFFDDSVSVLLNGGSGTYAAPVPYAAGTGLFSLITADTDTDGDLDIIAGNGDATSVSVLLNNGSAVFSAPLHYTSGGSPSALAAVDLNSDAKKDLVIANQMANTISVLFQTTNADLRVSVWKMDGITALTGATLSYKCTGGTLVTVTDGGTGDDDGRNNGVIVRDGARVAADGSLCTAGNPVYTQFDVKKDGYVVNNLIPPNYSTGAVNAISRGMTGNYRMKVTREAGAGDFIGLLQSNFVFGTVPVDFKEVGGGVYDFALPLAGTSSRSIAVSGYVTSTGTNTSLLSLQPVTQADDSASPVPLLFGVKVSVADTSGAPLTGLSVSTLRGVVPYFALANVLYFADTSGAGASLALTKPGYYTARLDNPAFESVTTGTVSQVAITLGAYDQCVTAPISSSVNCRGLRHFPAGGGSSNTGSDTPGEENPDVPSEPPVDGGVGGGDPDDAVTGIDTRGEPVYGTSPADGVTEEEVNILYPNTYFKSPFYDTVYLLTAKGVRRPFINAEHFFTWESDFRNIVSVTPATLAYYPLSAPMLPKPGVTLVKLQSSPQVYTTEADPLDENKIWIHWIPGEKEAIVMFGADWADYVIDLPDTLFTSLSLGDNETDFSPRDKSFMKKRSALLGN
jgi:hypothetical protein